MLAAIKAADARLLKDLPGLAHEIAAAIHARARSIEAALAYDRLLLSLKERNWLAAISALSLIQVSCLFSECRLPSACVVC